MREPRTSPRPGGLRRPFIGLLLGILAAGCTGPGVDYTAYPDYVASARSVWPEVMGSRPPDPFTNDDAMALHAEIDGRFGLVRRAYPDFREYFDAARAHAARDRALETGAGITPAAWAARVPGGDALALVQAYLGAKARGESTRRFWLGPEPPTAFEALLDYEAGRLGSDPVTVRVGRIEALAWTVSHRCQIRDKAGRVGWVRYTFLVGGSPSVLGILRVDGGVDPSPGG